MASPQLEHGFTRLSNELFEAILRYPFSGKQLKVLLALIRQSYGYSGRAGKEGTPGNICQVSYNQLAHMVNLSRISVIRAVGELIKQGIIEILKKGSFCSKTGNTFLIQKDYDKWSTSIKSDTSSTSISLDTRSVSTSDTSVGISYGYTDSKKRKKEKKGRRKSATQLPEDFILTDKRKSYASSKGIDGRCEDIFERFKLYHTSKGSLFIDWDAAWRLWVLNEIKYHPEIYQTKVEEGSKWQKNLIR